MGIRPANKVVVRLRFELWVFILPLQRLLFGLAVPRQGLYRSFPISDPNLVTVADGILTAGMAGDRWWLLGVGIDFIRGQ